MNHDFLDTSDPVESSGELTICHRELRARFQQELFPHRSYYALKLAQAASAAGAKAIDFQFAKATGIYEVSFESVSAWWDTETVERAFHDPFSDPKGVLRNLALGFLASDFESIVLRGPVHEIRISFKLDQLDIVHESGLTSESYSAHLEPYTAKSFNFERHLLETRCRLANCQVRINGVAESRAPLPGILIQKTVESQTGSFGLNLPPVDDYTEGEDCYMQSGESKQPLLILNTGELGREVSLESMFLLSNRLWGENTLCFIQDGVIIEKKRYSWKYGEVSGAVAFIDATDLQKDPTGLRIEADTSAQLEAAMLEWGALCELALNVFESESLPPWTGAARITDSDAVVVGGSYASLAPFLAVHHEVLPVWAALPGLVVQQLLVRLRRRRGGSDWRQSTRRRLECMVRKSIDGRRFEEVPGGGINWISDD